MTPCTGLIPRFHRLLVATDFSPASHAAFRAALATCAAFHASLVILNVFEYASVVPAQAGLLTPEPGSQMPELEALCQRSRRSLEDLRVQAVHAGLACETVLEAGLASEAILDTIDGRGIDLAILGTNALHGFERLVFGSTAEDVLRKSPCPVLTVGPQAAAAAAPPAGPIVFATDFDFTTIDAIRYAASFSHLADAPLHCLHVLPRTLEAGERPDVVPAIMVDALQQLVTESGVVIRPPVCATAYGSEVSHAVVDYARRSHAGLIVLGVRQASMLASHIPEHIAYRIIAEAPCPVLTQAFAVRHHPSLLAACL
jgi:nucleotide-binding universal stress UspA family protein